MAALIEVEGLDGGSEGTGFFFEGDLYGGVGGVCDELAPGGGAGAAADDEGLRSTGRPFCISSRPLRTPKVTPSMAARMRFSGVQLVADRPVRGAARGGEVGGALAVEEGQEDEAGGAGLRGREGGVDVGDGAVEGLEGFCVTTLVAFMCRRAGASRRRKSRRGATLPVGSSAGWDWKE